MPKPSPTPTKLSVWYQLYFVLASLIGLICLVFGVSTLINTYLISNVFELKSQRYLNAPPRPVTVSSAESSESEPDPATLSEENQKALKQWEVDQAQWQESQNFDYEAENRKREMARAIALILTGVPVFALHAPVIFKRIKT